MAHFYGIIALALILASCDPPFLVKDTDGADNASAFRTDTTANPSAGELIAETWCSTCHATSPDRQGSDVGPAWSTIAADPEKTDDYLRGFLTNPHGQMQGISLTRQQIKDLIAYIRTLGGS